MRVTILMPTAAEGEDVEEALNLPLGRIGDAGGFANTVPRAKAHRYPAGARLSTLYGEFTPWPSRFP